MKWLVNKDGDSGRRTFACRNRLGGIKVWRSGNGSKIRVTGVTKGGSRVILLEI